MGRRARAAALSLLWGVLWAGVSEAQEPNTNDCQYRPIAGTVPYQVGTLAVRSFAAAFSVSRMVDEQLAPELASGNNFAFAGRVASIAPVTYVPGFATNPSCRGDSNPGSRATDDRYARLPLSMSTGGLGFALGTQTFQFIYASNMTLSVVNNGSFQDSFAPHVLGAEGLLLGQLSPFRSSKIEGPQAKMFDYIAAGSVNLADLVVVRAGYVGSRGLHTGLEVPLVNVGGSATVTGGLRELASVRAFAGPYTTPVGVTSAFHTRSIISTGPRIDRQGRELAEPPVTTGWNTTHLRHEIGPARTFAVGRSLPKRYGQVEVATTSTPHPELYLAVASAFFGPAFVSGGWVKPPELRFLGSEGRGRFTGAVGVVLDPDFVKSDFLSHETPYPLLDLRVAVNDPDMLRLFPYAPQGAFSVLLNLHVAASTKEKPKP